MSAHRLHFHDVETGSRPSSVSSVVEHCDAHNGTSHLSQMKWNLNFRIDSDEEAYKKHLWDTCRPRYRPAFCVGFLLAALPVMLAGDPPGYTNLADMITFFWVVGGLTLCALFLSSRRKLMESRHSLITSFLVFVIRLTILLLRAKSISGNETNLAAFALLSVVLPMSLRLEYVSATLCTVGLAIPFAFIVRTDAIFHWVVTSFILFCTCVTVAYVAHAYETSCRLRFLQNLYMQRGNNALREELLHERLSRMSQTNGRPTVIVDPPPGDVDPPDTTIRAEATLNNKQPTASPKQVTTVTPIVRSKPMVGETAVSFLKAALKDVNKDNGGFADANMGEIQLIMKTVDSWNLPIFDLDALTGSHPLLAMGITLFQNADMFYHLELDRNKFLKFLIRVEQEYHSTNTYHNRIHAADVLQTAHTFTCISELKKVFSVFDILTIYFAAIIHDVDHPGVGNGFLVNVRDSKALMYNDISVLENHHASFAFQLMNNEDLNFAEGLPTKDYKRFRDETVEIVLATDLQHHFQFVRQFKARMAAVEPDGSPSFKTCDKADRLLLKKMIVKCADVSHAAKSRDLHLQWTERVIAEFFAQGDKERDLGIPISPFMDRMTCLIPDAQKGFIEYMCKPLYEALGGFVPLPVPLGHLEENTHYWNTIE